MWGLIGGWGNILVRVLDVMMGELKNGVRGWEMGGKMFSLGLLECLG